MPLTKYSNSPSVNPHLLQRSEVVALINTAHRFSESLHFVEEFRTLWAIAEDREVIIKKVEENIKVIILHIFHGPLLIYSPESSRCDTAKTITSRRRATTEVQAHVGLTL
jgi:hypothetical protein